MPKTDAERARAYIARKRQRARAAGLCYTCCKNVPKAGLAVCNACNAKALERKRRKRQTNAKQRGAKLVEAHEHAGDVAREHDFHAAAAQHYQDALRVGGLAYDANVDDRITRKLIHALFLGGEPGVAKPLYDRLLASYLATPGNGAKAIDIMLRIAQQLWVDSRTTETGPILTQAMKLAEKIGERSLWIRAKLTMHNYCQILGRYEEATLSLNNVRRVGNEYPAWLRVRYFTQLAQEAAVSGLAVKTYRYFERALHIVKKEHEDELYTVVITWDSYSYCSLILGDIERAKSCMERALLISRQHRFIWMVPLLDLEYANILTILGQSNSAYEYLLEALSYDAQAPVLERALAETGIPLALQMNDEAVLARCSRPTVLERVFQSEEPENISAAATAFAKLYYARGDKGKAQSLLHRAVEAVRPVAYGWDLPLEVARQGAAADIPRARMLLEARTALPRSTVARACLALFEAYVAQREQNIPLTHASANDAGKRFEVLGWHAYTDEARSLLPHAQGAPHASRGHSLPLADLQSVLTTREQEIAGFVLRGLTNRAIASELSITENTVEKHMTSIMNRLEIRSRHQLAAAIDSGFRDADTDAL